MAEKSLVSIPVQKKNMEREGENGNTLTLLYEYIMCPLFPRKAAQWLPIEDCGSAGKLSVLNYIMAGKQRRTDDAHPDTFKLTLTKTSNLRLFFKLCFGLLIRQYDKQKAMLCFMVCT